ncbi:Proton-coupled amino acid transporter [Apis cerana cerana]|uniref:Proton-coupled amino acid transporter n=1 Tax=Apis cerana cerana TaxID=94128 RepID=A0A2A3E4U9_APICC|nr:Proton-coupled amino acid transporter [Apis cerana cerana]
MIRKSKRNSGQLPPSFVPNSQIMPLENEMKKPKVFMKTFGVLNIGMGVIVALYTGMGFFGYIRYGGAIEGSITFSLGEPLALANAVQILLAIAIFFTHPIQCYVAIDIIWNEYIAPNLEKNSHKLLWEYVVRTSLVLLTYGINEVLLAVAIPQLDLFISLFGALCLSGLGLAFPAIIQICTFWTVCDRTERSIMVAKNMSLVLFGILGLIVGTYTKAKISHICWSISVVLINVIRNDGYHIVEITIHMYITEYREYNCELGNLIRTMIYTVLLEDMSKDYFIMNLKAIKISTKFIYLFFLSIFCIPLTQHSKYLIERSLIFVDIDMK